jgi:hypothetical protein
MNIEDISARNRTRVRTALVLQHGIGANLPPSFTSGRESGVTGTVINTVRGGGLFLVSHDSGTFATYHHTELSPEQPHES